LLYQVATGILSEGVIAPPLRGVVKKQANARTVLAEVTRFDLDARTVHGVSTDGRPLQRRYDTLVVAGGATHAYFGHDEWAAFAPGHEDARGCPWAARPHPVGVRAGRNDSRSRPDRADARAATFGFDGRPDTPYMYRACIEDTKNSLCAGIIHMPPNCADEHGPARPAVAGLFCAIGTWSAAQRGRRAARHEGLRLTTADINARVGSGTAVANDH
jgi:hypothetical protein